MIIKPLKLKGKKQRQWKKFLPLLLVALMLGSSLIVFTYSAGAGSKVRISIFTFNVISGNYETIYQNEFDFSENMTALQLLYMTNINVNYENGTITCIGSFCNLEMKWEFYVNNMMVLQGPEYYVLNANDDVLFVYR